MCKEVLAIFVFIIVMVKLAPAFATQPLAVTSPDGNLTISFALRANPQPYLPGQRAYYRVSYKGIPILTDSPQEHF
jgi:hypothetical protein